MKKILLLVMIVFMSMLSSCIFAESQTIVEYVYKNESGADIIIIDAYSSNKILEIPNNAEIINRLEDFTFVSPFEERPLIEVIFKDEKVLVYSSDDVSAYNNPLWINNYQLLEERKQRLKKYSYYKYSYTFTDEHYELAIPLDELEDPEI